MRSRRAQMSRQILPKNCQYCLSVRRNRYRLNSVLQLQSLIEPETEISAPSATDIFLEEARKDPMERLREQIMKELGISEADLAAMPPEERRAMEDRIRQLIEEKFRQGMGVDNAEAGSAGAVLQEFG